MTKIKSIFNLPSAWRTAPKVSKWVDERNKMPMRIVLNQETNGIDAWYYARCTKPSREVVVEWSDAAKIMKILAKCKPVKGSK